MTLPEFSVRQSVLVNVLFVVCLVGGCNALWLTEVEYFHDVQLNEIVISTSWPGSSADEVERLVTAKLEEELQTIGDIHEMRSASQANVSVINIEFDETLNDAEYESAVNDARGALDRVTDLPLDAEEPELLEIITSDLSPVVLIAITDEAGVGELALRDVAREAASRLRELPGVSKVEVRGLQDREVRVLVDRERAAAYGLTVADVADRVRRQNQNLPAGTFQDAGGEATVRATGDYTAVEQILDTVVREEGTGTRVRLRDVASVERGLEKLQFVTRYDGKPAAVVSVAKKDRTDVQVLVERVDAWLEGFAALVPPDISITKTLDTAAFVAPRIRVLIDNLVTGMLLVLVLLWFTIGFRNSVLTIIAIPFSFLTAIIFFPILGISINANTLIGHAAGLGHAGGRRDHRAREHLPAHRGRGVAARRRGERLERGALARGGGRHHHLRGLCPAAAGGGHGGEVRLGAAQGRGGVPDRVALRVPGDPAGPLHGLRQPAGSAGAGPGRAAGLAADPGAPRHPALPGGPRLRETAARAVPGGDRPGARAPALVQRAARLGGGGRLRRRHAASDRALPRRVLVVHDQPGDAAELQPRAHGGGGGGHREPARRDARRGDRGLQHHRRHRHRPQLRPHRRAQPLDDLRLDAPELREPAEARSACCRG